jgi:hypothetical protein
MRPVKCDRRTFLNRMSTALGVIGLPVRGSVIDADEAPEEPRAALAVRKLELQRRVTALGEELRRWKDRVTNAPGMNIHFSQIKALSTLMEAFLRSQQQVVDALNPQDKDQFLGRILDAVEEIIRAQGVWDYYRDKLHQRFSPDFEASLRVADVMAWDCYYPVLQEAQGSKLVAKSQMREPPLCYYMADFSPLTWVRGTQPDDLRDRKGATVLTPIPVIAIPWDHAENLWELLSVPHEVGHDIEADLNLRPTLLRSLRMALQKVPVPPERIAVWESWLAETFADLVALQLVGPSFTDTLMHILILPPQVVTSFNRSDPHPTPYVRVLMNAAYIRGLIRGAGREVQEQRDQVVKRAERIERVWNSLYGAPPALQEYRDDFNHVFRALMDTPLGDTDKTIRDLIPFEAADFAQIQDAAQDLEKGQYPGDLRPRHAIAAARMAVTNATKYADIDSRLKSINAIAYRMVKTPPDLLSADEDDRRDFIAAFAKSISIRSPAGGAR